MWLVYLIKIFSLASVSDEAVKAMKDAMEKVGIDFIAIGENSSNAGEGVRYARRGKK
jgi:hypothetical protein